MDSYNVDKVVIAMKKIAEALDNRCKHIWKDPALKDYGNGRFLIQECRACHKVRKVR